MSEHPSAPSTPRTLPVLGMVIVVAVTMVLLFAMPLFASPVASPTAPSGLAVAFAPATTPGVQQWAYGGTKTISGDITVTGANHTGFELKYHAFFGWTVVFTQTNTSTSTFQIEAQRTAAAQLYVDLCTPNCTSPTWTGNYTASATDVGTAFGNFTRDGVVYVGGSPTAALGFLNGSGNTQDSLHSQLTITGASGAVSKDFFNVTGAAQAQVSFTPELGLIPYNLHPGESWNSSAVFNLSASYALAWELVTPHSHLSGNPSGSVSATGPVELRGAYSQELSLQNGELTHILLVAISGPFDVLDGVIVVPHTGNVFSGDPHSMGGQGLGFAPVATTSAVDYDSGSSHLGIASAATSFTPTASGAVPAVALSPAATSSSGGDVQAQPMTVPVAQACAASLVKGGTCATTSGNGLTQLFHTTWFELVALAVGVVALVAVLAVAVGRRPRAPPPVRVPTGGARVPPGASGQLVPPPLAPPQQPSDPLGNLW
ncbi:MAG: hypothetical protein L3K14_06135 [Thermoplasmata archaeon]|nr:hypothetical protein [Thermoplasmata archaeon]